MKGFNSVLLSIFQPVQEGQKLHVITVARVRKDMLAQGNVYVTVASMGLHVSSVCREDTAWTANVGFRQLSVS